MELVRKVIQALEESPDGYAPHILEIDGYSAQEVRHHAYLIIAYGLADGADMTCLTDLAPH